MKPVRSGVLPSCVRLADSVRVIAVRVVKETVSMSSVMGVNTSRRIHDQNELTYSYRAVGP